MDSEMDSVCEREGERRRRWKWELTLLAATFLPLVLLPVVVLSTFSRLLVRLCELVYCVSEESEFRVSERRGENNEDEPFLFFARL